VSGAENGAERTEVWVSGSGEDRARVKSCAHFRSSLLTYALFSTVQFNLTNLLNIVENVV